MEICTLFAFEPEKVLVVDYVTVNIFRDVVFEGGGTNVATEWIRDEVPFFWLLVWLGMKLAELHPKVRVAHSIDKAFETTMLIF